MEFQQITGQRRSVKKFDPERVVSDAELARLFEIVALTPTSFNLQHQRFVVVRDLETKKLLRAASHGQAQVEEASAVVIVAGRLDAHLDAPEIYSQTPQAVQDALLPMIAGMYSDPVAQRDEAIRSAGMAAMTLMYAATDLGLASGPMIGFNPAKVAEIVGLDDRHPPLLMVVIGAAIGDQRPRPARHPLAESVRLESWDGAGLTGEG